MPEDSYSKHLEKRIKEMRERMVKSKIHFCQKDGCNNKARVKGLCINCYQRNRINKLRKE